jgi:hypothetical protein
MMLWRATIAVTVATAACVGVLSQSPSAFAQEKLEWLYQRKPYEYWRAKTESELPNEREEAIRAVASYSYDKTREVQALLIGMLDDPVPLVRSAAIDYLGAYRGKLETSSPKDVIEALAGHLTDPKEDINVRRAAVRRLGRLGVWGAEALASAMLRIDDHSVRIDALDQLCRIPNDLYNEVEETEGFYECIRQLTPQEAVRGYTYVDQASLICKVVQRLEPSQGRKHALTLLCEAERIGDIATRCLIVEINSDNTPSIVRKCAIQELLNYSDHKAAAEAIDTLTAGMESKDDVLRICSAAALAAISPDSPAGDQAVSVLVEELLPYLQANDFDSEEIFWGLGIPTGYSERRDEIFERILARIEDKQLAADVQSVRLGILEDLKTLTPDLLLAFLEYQEPYLLENVAEKLAEFGPKVAKQAAPALAKVLQELPEDDLQASDLADAIVEALSKIDPQAKYTPRLDSERLVRLVYLYAADSWVIEQFRNDREALQELANYVERLPANEQPTEYERKYTSGSTSERFTSALGQVGEPAIPALKRLIINYPRDHRGRNACQAIRLIQPACVEVLIELAGHQDDAVRQQAFYAISDVAARNGPADAELIETLISAAKDDNLEIRQSSIRGLGRLDAAQLKDVDYQRIFAVLIESLYSGNDSVSSRAIESLRKLGETNPEPVIAELRKFLKNDKSSRSYTMFWTLKFFGEKSMAALPELRQIIKQNEKYRTTALETIVLMGPAAALQSREMLRETLASSDPGDQLWAAIALSQLGDEIDAVVPVLVNSLKTRVQTDTHVRKDPRVLAAEALGRLGPAAEPAIDTLLEIVSRRLQLESRYADHESTLKEAAIVALGQIGKQPEKVVPVLAKLLELDRKDRWAGESAAHHAAITIRALAQPAEYPAHGLVRRLEDRNKKPELREMILAMGERAVPELAKALDDNDLAKPAAELLGQMGETASPAVPELLNVVRDRTTDWATRVAAIEALGLIGEAGRPAVPYIEVFSKDDLSGSPLNQKQVESARQALRRIRS